MKKTLLALLALLVGGAAGAATPWQKITSPIPGSAQSIGGFSNGCVVGAQPLALNAADYQVMRVDKRRYFGHPDLLNFIARLSRKAHQAGMETLLIGDLGMAAGGRFNSGHASHQTGLDVDIFLQLPQQRWSATQLARPQALDLVAVDGKRVLDRLWQPQIGSLIKLAAQDNDVARIFVNPAIKRKLCETQGQDDRAWLRKVRPWFAHRAHMHVRLRCPASSLECVDQPPPPPGDGCGYELQSWFEPAKPGGKPVKKPPPALPPSCQALLDNHLL
ncbi:MULTISPECIES: penicillin-insensitive murein endopeptidase [Tenebrionibacter/Tenebrionicola group]|jgi:penicillin-insensitive murein endopeptidase|uniref:Penicillin-insensitive murein endopeptidase n=2 Tax=Tenebrionibacter/Tenebrionicola group TaxID=2969848 RepID=A0A8K0V311_9ENTR|nr:MULTISPECIES: penicillin-insensitive murein endopeptidase [Tenebrionibacter/Tenebrionicola group]MBK4715901.1 penicillin-insensitive murein endopeptidase [Tenebrionibacter intestinalis]MBV5096660.1 penicillin-insensitive murein endopeptidase [Tenebrionicola larvae]